MDYRPLGRTGVKVSSLCLGTMNFGDRTEASEAYDIVDAALDHGVNFIDTADIYNLGRSEEIVGEALKRNGKRDHVVLATKVHNAMSDDVNDRGNSRRHIVEACNASLRRLQTDWIDLYQIHRPQSEIAIDETLRALDDLVRAGKVRYLGTSTFAAWQVVEALWTSKELGLHRFVSEQPPYNLLDRRIERELLPMARTFGIGVIPWSPLGMGILTGKYAFDQEPPAKSRFDQPETRSSDVRQARWTERGFAVVSELRPIAASKGCTMSQLAIAWCLAQPGVTSVIMGPRTLEQLEDNLGALDVRLDDEDLGRIDETIAPGDAVSPFYDADFGPHVHRI